MKLQFSIIKTFFTMRMMNHGNNNLERMRISTPAETDNPTEQGPELSKPGLEEQALRKSAPKLCNAVLSLISDI